MEKVLDHLDHLARSGRLVPAEQVLMSSLLALDRYLVNDTSEDLIHRAQATLTSLLNVQKGDISIQCALFISTKLVKTYQLDKNPQIWDFLNFAIDNTTTATTIAAGYVLRHIGHQFKAQLPRYIEHLLTLKQNLEFSSMYALRGCFKAGGKTVEQYIPRVIDYVKKSISKPRQATVVRCVKLMKSILSITQQYTQQFLDICHTIMNTDQFPFVKNEVSALVAKCAAMPLLTAKQVEQAEWAIGAMNEDENTEPIEKALSLIQQFPAIQSHVIPHFLDSLTTTVISKNHSPLFHFFRHSALSYLDQLVPVLPTSVRFTYFQSVAKEELSAEQLKVLEILCPDDGSINEAAGVALLLSCSDQKSGRHKAHDFFVKFSQSHPVLSLPYLRAALVFLAQPPEVNLKMEQDTRGNLKVASAILQNVRMAIDSNREVIEHFITHAIHNESPESLRFAGAFELLALLTDQFSKLDGVEAGVSGAITFLNQPEFIARQKEHHRLLKRLIAFRSRFINREQGLQLVEIAVKTQNATLKMGENLAKLATVCCDKGSNLCLQVSVLLLKLLLRSKPGAELTKHLVTRPLPTGFDLLKIQSATKLTRDQERCLDILDQIPPLLKMCPDDLSPFFDLITVNGKIGLTGGMVFLTVAKQAPQLLPKNTALLLMQQMTSQNLSHLQIISEAIAFYSRHFTGLVSECMKWAEKSKNIAGCILISALFTHVQPSGYVSKAILYLNSTTKISSVVPFAVHAIISVMLSNAMEATGFALNELTLLFQTLHTTVSMQPAALHLCGELFRLLIEIASADLTMAKPLVELMVRTIEVTPLSYAKEVYFGCVRSILTFAHHMSDIVPITFPRTTRPTLALSACEAFTDLLKFERNVELPVTEIFEQLLILLQKTGDDRCVTFIATLSQLESGSVGFWVSQIRRIWLSSSLFEGTSTPIEPTATVKDCFIRVCSVMIDRLSRHVILNQEHLDDIISAACFAVESGRISTQTLAFPVLQKVIEKFKDRKTDEGVRILDLHDSQFSQAVKVGFTINLSISGGFLTSFLTFHAENIEDATSVLLVYLDSLSHCNERSTSFFSLASQICEVVRKFPADLTVTMPFLTSIAPVFAEIVKEAMSLFKDPSDWRTITSFRKKAFDYYASLLPSFVWLSDSKSIPSDSLISFLIVSIQSTFLEDWMTRAAFNAIPVAVEKIEMTPDLLLEALQSCEKYVKKSNLTFSEVLVNASKKLKAESSYDRIRSFIVEHTLGQNSIHSEMIAYILRSDKEHHLRAFIPQFVEKIISEKLNEKVTLALFLIVFDYDRSLVGVCLQKVLEMDRRDLKFDIIRAGLYVAEGAVPIDGIARFCIETFNLGGMNLVASVLIKRPEIGVALLAKGNAKAAFLLCSNDLNNSRAYLRFVQLAFETHQTPEFAESVFRLCCAVIVKFGNDVMRGHQLVQNCVQIISEIAKIADLRALFEALEERDKVARMIEEHIKKAQRIKSTQPLAFSNVQRQSKSSEWQTLGDFTSSSDDEEEPKKEEEEESSDSFY